MNIFSNLSIEWNWEIDSEVIIFDWKKFNFSRSNIRSNVVRKEKLLEGIKIITYSSLSSEIEIFSKSNTE